MTVLTWDEFVVDLHESTGLEVDRRTRLEDLSTGPMSSLTQLMLLAHLEKLAGESIEPDLFETIETVEELWDWAMVIAERAGTPT